jgi:hypothetical protein
MRPNALRRAIGAAAVIAASALILGNHIVGVTSASFSGETRNAGSGFAGGWVGAPAAGTAVARGYDVALAWTPGTHGPVTGQKLNGLDNGTSSNCTGAVYGLLASLASATTASYTDSSRGTLANDGDWYCYEIMSTSGTAWTAPFDLAAVQLGLVATGVSIANTSGGTVNTLEGGDTITITFNQRTTIGTTSVKVCTWANTIAIGDGHNGNSCGGSATADGYTIGLLTTTSTITGTPRFSGSTVAVSTTSPYTVVVTLGSGGTGTVPSGTSWKFSPAAAVKSNLATHQATACTTTATTCQPTTSTGF